MRLDHDEPTLSEALLFKLYALTGHLRAWCRPTLVRAEDNLQQDCGRERQDTTPLRQGEAGH